MYITQWNKIHKKVFNIKRLEIRVFFNQNCDKNSPEEKKSLLVLFYAEIFVQFGDIFFKSETSEKYRIWKKFQKFIDLSVLDTSVAALFFQF